MYSIAECNDEKPYEDKSSHASVYDAATLVNYWDNARAIEEAHRAIISYKKVNCQLLSSRTRALLRNVLAPVALSPCTGGIQYNKNYQIFSPSLPTKMSREYPYEEKGLYLSGMIDESNIDHGTDLMNGCLLTASKESMPCRRNTFTFIPAMPNAHNVYYGDDFFIQSNAGTKPLYVQAENNPINFSEKSMTLRLSQQRDVYTYFKILHAHPRARRDSLGMPVMPDTTLVIRHVASGQNMAADPSSWVTTFFGLECMASVCTYRNSNRIETAENMWQIIGHVEKLHFNR